MMNSDKVGSMNSPLYIALTFLINFGIGGAYWIFAHRYWELSMKLHELKYGSKLFASYLESPLNIIIWILIFGHATSMMISKPNFIPLLSFSVVVVIDSAVWIVMLDAMNRIWKMGNEA